MSEPFSMPAFTMADYHIYRVDDRIFYVFVIVALVFCLIHAAFRIFMRRRAEETQRIQPAGDEEIQRHSLFQRVFHWANALAVFALTLSGWMLYRQPPQIPNPEQSASTWFLWHLWGIALLMTGLLAHIVREAFVAKDENPMAFSRMQLLRILSFFKDFPGFFKTYPPTGKYHTGQIFFHWAVAGNIFALILTGMVLWTPFRNFLPLSLFGLGWDFIYFNRVIHGFFSATLIASLIAHLYFALGIKTNWPVTRSMVTGNMSLRKQ